MPIEVCNLNKTRNFGKEGDVQCDRETKWGNPFIMYYESRRDIVCDLYEDYLEEIIKPGNVEMVRKVLKAGGLTEYQVNRWIERTSGFLDISELKGARRLFCHCSNLRCHCDTLKKRIEALEEPIELVRDNHV